MKKQFERFSIIVGDDNLEILSKKHVAIFGLGGVGSFAAEAIIRSGVGQITLVDYDTIDITNINRQIPALFSTIGKNKTYILKDRFLDINPYLKINCIEKKFQKENHTEFFADYDYIVDAIDMVSSKIFLILKAHEENIPIISSMGMGNKLNPLDIRVSSLDKTHTCPLAKVMRRELKKYNISSLKCVFSTESPRMDKKIYDQDHKLINGSSAFVPSVAGLVIASQVVKELIEKKTN